MRLCLALGYRSLRDFRLNFPTDEFPLWQAFQQREGLPLQRLEAGIALTGSALLQAWGAKVTPRQLIPRFGPEPILSGEQAGLALRAWASVRNKGLRNAGGQPKLTTKRVNGKR